MSKIYCHLCYSTNVEEDQICDICGEYYCDDCSYTFSLHYQFQGSRCYLCADQRRLKKLTKVEIRQNKLKLITEDD